jgi:hypothetical protein
LEVVSMTNWGSFCKPAPCLCAKVP